MIKYHLAMDSSVPDGAAIFLGDSITQGLATSAVAPRSVNYGIGWATCDEVLSNIPSYHSLNRASVIFLMIGTNDIGRHLETNLPTCYKHIVDLLPKDVPLVWSGVMPVYPESVRLQANGAANQTIIELCSKRPNCRYIDTNLIFSPQSGGALLFRDGLHPNDKGYAGWIRALRESFNAATVGSV